MTAMEVWSVSLYNDRTMAWDYDVKVFQICTGRLSGSQNRQQFRSADRETLIKCFPYENHRHNMLPCILWENVGLLPFFDLHGMILEIKDAAERRKPMNADYVKLLECYESFRSKVSFQPKVAIVLGSGLGDFADTIEVVQELPYEEIAGFPVSTVPGHAGKFIFGYVGQVPVVCMKGRVHYYEGYSMGDVVLPTRLMKLMGAEILFLTNASGGVNQEFSAGDLMMITDQISCFVPNPLIGSNIEELGTRFPDMSTVYDKDLQKILREVAKEYEIPLKEGVYVQLTGPSFESPAEIRMVRALGADAVGMSTVVEAIAANHAGMRICGISCVCNLAAGMTENPLTHTEVQEAADQAAPRFTRLVAEAVKRFL